MDGFTLELWGTYADSASPAITIGNEMDGFKWALGTLIMQLFWLAVLWISVMAALWSSKVTEAVVEPIASFGKQVWGLVAKSPQYLPVFGGQSMQSMKQTANSVSWHYQSQANNKSADFLKDTRFGNSAKDVATMGNIETALKKVWTGNHSESLRQGQLLLKEVNGDYDKLWKNPATKSALLQLMKNAWVDKTMNIADINGITSTNVHEIIWNIEASDGIYKDLIWWVDNRAIKKEDIINASKEYAKDWVDSSKSTWSKTNEVYKNNDAKLVEIKFWDQKISIDDNWLVKAGRYDNFARWLKWQSYSNVKKDLDKEWVENFEEMFNKVKEELEKTWSKLDVNENGIIEIDLSKEDKQ
jgi:hypothetical protein